MEKKKWRIKMRLKSRPKSDRRLLLMYKYRDFHTGCKATKSIDTLTDSVDMLSAS